MAEERKTTRKRKVDQPKVDVQLKPTETYTIEGLKGSPFLKEGVRYSVSGASAMRLIEQGKAKLV